MGDIVGRTIGNYHIMARVGHGSMGVVFRAKQVSMDREIALKVLPTKLAQDETYVRRFLTEARAAGKISHPNIVGVHEVVKFGETYAFSMDYVDGQTAQNYIERNGTFEEDDALRIAGEIAGALAAAHGKGIIHRDVKPDNIMIDSDGTSKLADLGLARLDEPGAPRLTAPGISIGTPYYMAPEEAKAETVDHRADIYSLGASLFHMVTGHVPFEAPTAAAVMVKSSVDPTPDARALNPEVSPEFSRLIKRLMAKEPTDRPPSADAAAALIDKVATGAGIDDTARRPRVGRTRGRTGAGPASRGGSSGLQIGIGVAGALVLTIIMFAVFSSSGSKKTRKPDRPDKSSKEDEERMAAEARARAARIAFRAIEEWADAHPDDLAAARSRYEKFIEEHPLASEAEIARSKVQGLNRLIAASRAEGELADLIARAKAKAGMGNFGDAIELLEETAGGRGALAAKAREAIEEIKSLAADRFAAISLEAAALAANGDFAGARRKLQAVIDDFDMPELADAAKTALAELDRQEVASLSAAERKAFDDAVAAAAKLAAARKYRDARDSLQLVASKLKTDDLKKQARIIATDYDRARKAHQNAAMKLSLGSKTRLSRIGLASGGELVGMVEAGLKVKSGGDNRIIPWRDVPPRSYFKAVEQNMIDKEGKDYLNIGALGLIATAYPETKGALLKALNLDPTLKDDVDRYLAMIEPKLAALREGEAEKIFDSAKANAARKLSVRVAALVKQLKGDYGDTEFVKTHMAEIDALLGSGDVAAAAPVDAVTALKKLGWQTVEGTWKAEKGGIFTGEGDITLESPTGWKDAAVVAEGQIEEGEKLVIMIRYDKNRQNAVNQLGGRAGGRRGGMMANFLGPEYDVPQGYGIIIEKMKLRIVDGGRSPFGNFGRRGGGGGLNGLPREVRALTSIKGNTPFNSSGSHKYLVTLKGEALTVIVDGMQVYQNSQPKQDTGSVVITGQGVKLKLKTPQVKQLR